MPNHNHLLRGIVGGRWFAAAGIIVVLALGYGLSRPAQAQDRPQPSSSEQRVSGGSETVAEKGSGAKADGDGLLSKEKIDALAASATSGGDADKKAGPPIKEADTSSILHDIKWLSPHMWAFYAIWVVSLISVSFAVERFLGLRRSKILPAQFAAGMQAAISRKGEFDLRHAQRLCKQYPSMAASVVKAMLAKVGRPLPEIEKAMTESLEHEATRLYANVRVQNLTFNVAPMLGLAGTVHGIILCFYSTAHLQLGANKMDALATGIYAALVCTLAGLLVAIPAGVLAHYFEGRILKMSQKVEDLARSLVPELERFEGRPRLSVSDDKLSRGAAIIGMPRDDDGDPDDDDVDPIRTLIENGRRDRDADNPLPAPKPKKA